MAQRRVQVLFVNGDARDLRERPLVGVFDGLYNGGDGVDSGVKVVAKCRQ
jgi:hypothetical protein